MISLSYWFMTPLLELYHSVGKHTGHKAREMDLYVSPALGESLGLEPGQVVHIHTAVGTMRLTVYGA